MYVCVHERENVRVYTTRHGAVMCVEPVVPNQLQLGFRITKKSDYLCKKIESVCIYATVVSPVMYNRYLALKKAKTTKNRKLFDFSISGSG